MKNLNKMKINIFVTLTLLSISFSVIGQKEARIPKRFKRGYIIKNEGDTIFGYVNYNDILYIKFRDQNGKKKTYTASKIKGFTDLDQNRIMESYYLPHKDAIYFFERIVSGNFPLYFCFENASSEVIYVRNGGALAVIDYAIARKYISSFYFKKENKLQAIPANEKQFKITILDHFGHIKHIKEKTNSDSLFFENVINIFEIINRN